MCGVSHRFVEADDARGAERAVVEAIVAALDVRADAADPGLRRLYAKAGPLQRKNLLARLDGLTNPSERRSARSAKRRLERMALFEEQERAWVGEHPGPPVSPAALDQLVRLLEVRHIEESLLRLPEWDRRSPIHGEGR